MYKVKIKISGVTLFCNVYVCHLCCLLFLFFFFCFLLLISSNEVSVQIRFNHVACIAQVFLVSPCGRMNWMLSSFLISQLRS